MDLLSRLNTHRNRLARFYDAGEHKFDRYTAVYLAPDCTDQQNVKWFSYRAASEHPFSPCGLGLISQHEGVPLDWSCIAKLGRCNHLGRRVCFNQLPLDVQSLIIRDLTPTHT
jgi:hypothetical protein